MSLTASAASRVHPRRQHQPQWAPDGRALYFISNPEGIPNLYRVELATGELAQLTNVGTGLSGITSSSPAMSVSARSEIASFSVYENGRYDIYTLNASTAGGPLVAISRSAAVLPPIDRKPSEVAAFIANPTFGLPPPERYEIVPYHVSLSLEGIGQPAVAVGASPFGVAVGGGVSFYFSDMLGDHTLATAVQFNSGFGGNFSVKDTAAQAAYFNQTHRWNWGTIVGQIPYLSGAFQTGFGTTLEGEPVEVDQAIVYRQTERSASGIVSYPFDRARRIEFQGGATQVSFDQIECLPTTTSDCPAFDRLLGSRVLVGNVEFRFRCCVRLASLDGCTDRYQSKPPFSLTPASHGTAGNPRRFSVARGGASPRLGSRCASTSRASRWESSISRGPFNDLVRAGCSSSTCRQDSER
jgi:hypothetical protein